MTDSIDKYYKMINDLRSITPDLIILCAQGERVSAIKNIVIARCEPFKCMLNGAFKENGTNEINLSEYQAKYVQMFIDYLQFADTPKNARINDLIELYYIADNYLIDELKSIIEDKLNRYATEPTTAPFVYQQCIDDRFSEIRSTAFEHIVNCIDTFNYICTRCAEPYSLDVGPCSQIRMINFSRVCCGGKIVKGRNALNMTDICDTTKLEIFNKLIG